MREINKRAVLSSHSREMNDVIGKPPHWIVNRGSALLLVIFLLAAAVTYFIPYPDTITTELRLSHPVGTGYYAQVRIPDEKAKAMAVSQKTDICFVSPSGSYRVFMTGRIMKVSPSAETGFSIARIALTDTIREEEFERISIGKDSVTKAVITTRTEPLLFALFRKTSP